VGVDSFTDYYPRPREGAEPRRKPIPRRIPLRRDRHQDADLLALLTARRLSFISRRSGALKTWKDF
jgi:hypothetical protein